MANWFVKPGGGSGGTGTGVDWNNAWAGFVNIAWASINPGDTIWLQGGTYNETPVIGASGASLSPILIQRATAGDSIAVNSPGWLPSFDAQVVITSGGTAADVVTLNQSFITIDGRTLQGIKIIYGNVNGGSGIAQSANGGAQYQSITLQNILCFGPGVIMQVGTASVRGMSFSHQQGMNNLTVRHCETANGGSAGAYFTGPNFSNILLEYNLFHDAANGSTGSGNDHPNALFLGQWTSGTIRYNKIYGIEVEGLFFGFLPISNVYIYGNLLYQGSVNIVARNTGRGIEFDQEVNPVTNVFIYNNTIVDLPGAAINLQTTGGITYTNVIAKNNLSWNNGSGGAYNFGSPGTTNDYNFSSDASNTGEPHGIINGTNPFVNYVFQDNSSDYHIVATIGPTFPRNKGVALTPVAGQTLNLDMDGVDRTNSWSMGAFEFPAGTTTIRPFSPGGVNLGTAKVTTPSVPRLILRPFGKAF